MPTVAVAFLIARPAVESHERQRGEASVVVADSTLGAPNDLAGGMAHACVTMLGGSMNAGYNLAMPTSATPPGKAKRKTCKRYNEPGHAHSLTFCCFHRQPFLSRDRTRAWMLDAIRRACDTHDLDLWAYVVMPEHVHLVVHPRRDPYDISRILSSLKQPVSKRAILYLKENAPSKLAIMSDRQPNGKISFRFWQRGGGYDRNLWSPKYIWETIDYVHRNPVRRGLCDREIDWTWSSASDYADRNDGPLRIDTASLPNDPRQLNAP